MNMTTSQTEIIVNGLKLSVYGLTEYKKLPEEMPVAIMFAMHGRLQNKTKMEAIAQVLCSLNASKGGQPRPRHLLVVAFDHQNHGTRLVDRKANSSWKEGKHQNPNHAVDMWSMVNSASHTVTELIDVLEYYLFGPSLRPVQVWGCLGFSMGAHASFLVAANDPRITVQIAIVGSSDYTGLMRARLSEGSYPDEYLPNDFCAMVNQRYDGLADKLTNTKVLMISGGEDHLVPGKFNDGLVQTFKASTRKEYRDWARIIVPKVGHAWCPEMFELSTAWVQHWMLSGLSNSDSFVLSLPSSCRL